MIEPVTAYNYQIFLLNNILYRSNNKQRVHLHVLILCKNQNVVITHEYLPTHSFTTSECIFFFQIVQKLRILELNSR